MVLLKQLKAEEESLIQQRQVVSELNTIVKDIECCEKSIGELQAELMAMNAQNQRPRNTRQDIAYLSALLGCARKKLGWEKQISSLRKRTPSVLQQMSALLNDPLNPPGEQARAEMLMALHKFQVTLERLQALNVE
jgi:hypothetical protein